MKVALVHDWLTGMRGGEKCLEVFCRMLPDAPIYTLFHIPGSVSEEIERHEIRTSSLQQIPDIATRYQRHLLKFQDAIEEFDFSGFDLILSCSHCVGKSIRTPPGAVHVCYIFTPMRYIWDMMHSYFGGWKRLALPFLMPWIKRLRRRDQETASRVTRFVAISEFVAERVRRTYPGHEPGIVYPPVALDRFPLSPEMGSHYLMVAADSAYKRADLGAHAFAGLDYELQIVGKRQDQSPLAGRYPNVHFNGFVSDERLMELYTTARGFVLPCQEEFGIATVEAMACGKPVVALKGGAAPETVARGWLPGETPPDSPNGVFFAEEDVEQLRAAVRECEAHRDRFDPASIRQHAMQFDESLFWPNVVREIRTVLPDFDPPLG